MPNRIFQFRDFTLNTNTRELLLHQKPVPISSKAYEILLLLIENQGEVVTKNEILEQVWKDTFVEEANLPVHISALRRVLNENKGESKFIKTISSKGYMFVADVHTASIASKEDFLQTQTANNSLKLEESDAIAVLPFSIKPFNQESEYLENGLTQSLINDLSKNTNLRVLSFEAVKKYKGIQFDIQELGFLLGSNKILVGRIYEFGEKYECNIELINSTDNSNVWGFQRTFEKFELFEIKQQIADTVSKKLVGDSEPLLAKNFPTPEKFQFEAHKLYYKGIFLYESRFFNQNTELTLNEAIAHFHQALEIEPDFALVYVGIAQTYISLYSLGYIDKHSANEIVSKNLVAAFSIDEKLSEYYVTKAHAEVTFNDAFRPAAELCDKAIDLNSGNFLAYHFKAYIKLCLGKLDEALKLALRALEFDPLSIKFNANLFRIYFFSGNYAQAIIQAEEISDLANGQLFGNYMLALGFTELEDFDSALEKNKQALKISQTPELFLNEAYIYAKSGNAVTAKKILFETLEKFPDETIDQTDIASVYSALGELDEAFACLENAINDEFTNSSLIFIKSDPAFTNLRNDERFEIILKRLNLVE